MRRGRLTLLFSFPPSRRDRIDHGFTHPCLENFRWRWWWMLNTIDWLEWERDARCEDGAASGKRFDGSIYGCERAKDPRSRLQISRRDILIPTLISSCPNPAQSMMFECPHATSLGGSQNGKLESVFLPVCRSVVIKEIFADSAMIASGRYDTRCNSYRSANTQM